MKRMLVAAVLTLAVAIMPAQARNFAVPDKDPAALVTIPDSWKTEEITYGVSAKSPDGDVFFSIEYASGSRLDKMLANNDIWMKENEIKQKAEPTKREIELGGLKASLISYQAEDGNGDTQVDFVLIPAGKGRVIMLTLWASEDEQKANQADILAIQKSVRALN